MTGPAGVGAEVEVDEVGTGRTVPIGFASVGVGAITAMAEGFGETSFSTDGAG
jgi:hypothetical protein